MSPSFSDFVPFFLIPFIGWGVRNYLKKNNRFTKLNKATLTIGIISYFLTETARSFYRPYIYSNGINDFFIADTIGNSLGTVTAVFMILTLAGKGTKKDFNIIFIIILGLIGYEFLNINSSTAFDYKDVLATIIFGSFSFIVYILLLSKYKT